MEKQVEIGTIKTLLSEVSAIIKQYEKVAELTGENFNVFKILGVETKEVKTHSAFIAELLKPDGSHGQGDVFLKLFIEQLEINDFKCENAKVEVEKHVGFISDDKMEGGYIDIVISNNTKAIIIENKIYAGDQLKQLERYARYGESVFKGNYEIFYLTLDKHEPDVKSLDEVSKNKAKLISYNDEILIWLEKCREKSATQPILRESITQYIYLIKHLTGQTMNDKMKNEMSELIKANYFAAHEISINFESTRTRIIDSFWKEVIESLSKKFNNQKTDWEIIIDSKNNPHNRDLIIKSRKWETTYFYFNDIYSKLYFGIDSTGIIGSDLNKKNELRNKFPSILTKQSMKSTTWSVVWRYERKYNFADEKTVYDMLINKEELLSYFTKIIMAFVVDNKEFCDEIERLNKK